MTKGFASSKALLTALVLFLVQATDSSLLAKEAKPQVIRAERVSPELSCLYGEGGNVGVLKAADGLLVVDSKFAKTAADLKAAIRTLSRQPVRILVNTHHHGDHVGGNGLLGQDARIIAHQNCRKTLLASLAPGTTAAEAAIPTETYAKQVRFEFGSEVVQLIHFGPGHTSGDSVVVFENAKVVMTGDLFFHGMPPYIDVAAGADTANWIRTLRTLAERYPDFKVIPGHGQVASMKELSAFAAYLGFLRQQVSEAMGAKKTREQAMKTIDMTRYAHLKERGDFLTLRNNVGWVYDEMSRK